MSGHWNQSCCFLPAVQNRHESVKTTAKGRARSTLPPHVKPQREDLCRVIWVVVRKEQGTPAVCDVGAANVRRSWRIRREIVDCPIVDVITLPGVARFEGHITHKSHLLHDSWIDVILRNNIEPLKVVGFSRPNNGRVCGKEFAGAVV